MPNIYLSIFKKVIAATAQIKLAFSPLYDNNYGWGEPFYDTSDPPLAINEPFGTALGSATNQDDRNKVSLISGATASTTFGEQKTLFPGNNTWTDGTNTLNYWSICGYGHVDRIARNLPRGNTIDELQIGDTGRIDEFLPDQGVGIITSKTGDQYNYEWLRDLNNNFWVNGVMHTPTIFHVGGGGRWITGCGMLGDWIIYNDVDWDLYSGPVLTATEYVNAYNIVTQENRLLGSFTYEHRGSGENMVKVAYSQNGLKFITVRNVDIDTLPRAESLEGFIGLDGFGDPVSLAIVQGDIHTDIHIFYYGYKDNVSEMKIYYDYTAGSVFTLELHDWDVQTGSLVGYMYDRQTDPINKDFAQYYVVMFNDVVSIYAINQTTGEIDLTAPYSQYAGLDVFLSDALIKSALSEPWFLPTSFIQGSGAFTVTWFSKQMTYTAIRNNKRVNGFFDDSGGYTDLGIMLLDTTMAGELFCLAPLSFSKN